jgi:hypothetical protein
MANNKDFKVKNSIKPTAYHEGVGPATSGTAGPDGLFSTTLYETNFASNTVTTGIDGTGSSKVLYWAKPRVDAAQDNHALVDNVRQTSYPFERLTSNTTDVPTSSEVALGSFTSTGFTLGQAEYFNGNLQGNNSGGGVDEVVWGFKAASNFFDIVTYTGNGSTQNISHNLGSVPGTIIVKKTNSTANWLVYHRSLGNDKAVFLNLASSPSTSSTYWNATTPTSSVFSVGANSNTNGNSDTFVAYLFAHDESSSSMIKCGSYDGQATVDLGWEPQWILFKNVIASSSWRILDTERGIPVGTGDLSLAPDRSDAEISTDWVDVNSTGFEITTTNANVAATNGSGTDGMIYVAIRAVVPTETLDLSTGAVFDVTPTSDSIISITNPAASGTVSQATMLLTGGAANTYDVANATYDSKSFDFSDYEPTFLYDGFFKPDGTKFFIIGTGTDKVQAFNLSTAWDISTVSAASEEFSPTQAGAEPISLSFKSDGTKMYVSSYGGLTVYQYSLSTAWDVSSATYDSKSFSYGTQANAAYHIELSSDGTKLYVNNTGSGSPGFIYQYTLSTAWDISTASYDSVALDLDASPAPSLAANCYTFTFSDDGTKLFNMAENAGDAQVITYNLTSAWDISTATYADEDYDITVGNQNNPVTFRVGDSGAKMYYGGTGDQTIYQFTIASAATITYDTTIEWPGGTAPTSPSYGETDVLTFTTTDGGTTYQGSLAIDGAK